MAPTKTGAISSESVPISIRQVICEIIGFFLSLVSLIPFLMIAVNSMKDFRGANQLSLSLKGVSFGQALENYATVFREANLMTGLLNSFIVTSLSVLCIVIFSGMAAYTATRRKTRAMRLLNTVIISGLTLPMAMVPTYFLLNKINLSTGVGAYLGAVIVYTASNFAFAYFLYSGFIKGVSSEIDEAAVIDGASPLSLYFKIVFPLLKPVTVTVIISGVMTMWNDFSVALYLLNNPKRTTAVLTTYLFSGQKSAYWNLLFSDVILVSLPVVVLYLSLQKYIVAGLTAGAVKG